MWSIAIFVCFGWLLSICLHEFGHAVIAYFGGDTSVKEKGYLTLNPVKYIDPFGSIALPIIFLLIGGIALPGAAVYINYRKLRSGWWKSAVCAAGPIASTLLTILLATPFLLKFKVPEVLESGYWFWQALAFLIILEITAVLFNLLPIPGLDGYGIIEPLLPQKIQIKLRKVGKYGIIIFFMLLWFIPPLNQLFLHSSSTIASWLNVPKNMVATGYNEFKSCSSILLVGLVGIFVIVHNFSDQGNKFIVNHRYEKAVSYYNSLLRFKPEYYEGWYKKGYALMQLKFHEEALKAYDKAIAIKPDYYTAWVSKCVLLKNLQKYEEAIECCNKAIDIDPNLPQAWDNKGWVLIGLKRYADAIASYDQAIEIQPDVQILWNNRGMVLGHLHRYADAIASFERAIELEPNYPYAWYNKACCYAEQGNFDLALENLEEAIYLDRNTFIKYAKTDSSFAAIRENQVFKRLIGEN